jgi:hypothetical protein
MNRKHTPLPWNLTEHKVHLVNGEMTEHKFTVDLPENGFHLAEIKGYGERAANAAFFFRACNSHYELLEALEKASDFIHDALPDNPEYKELAKTIRAILDKAEK